jgi:V/A-type H+-transporting ATPase subunit D
MKYELMQLQQQLTLARTGHHLLDKKHQALLAELRGKKAALELLRTECASAVALAYDKLGEAYGDMGREAVEKMRVIPHVNGAAKVFPLAGTSASMDKAYFAWQQAKGKLAALVYAENDCINLSQAVQKTRRRTAALLHIIIPAYEARINYIRAKLEESERDALARLKQAAKSTIS